MPERSVPGTSNYSDFFAAVAFGDFFLAAFFVVFLAAFFAAFFFAMIQILLQRDKPGGLFRPLAGAPG
jgi:hypothetical protein